jgi:hypothetical protein
MFMVVHAAAGALAGEAVSRPVAALVLGIISHFFLDMIPHGDEAIYQGYLSGKKSKRKRAYFHVGLDALATLVLVTAMFLFQDFTRPANVAWGIAGGLLPDLMVGLSHAFRPHKHKGIRWRLDRYSAFHRWNHSYIISRWKRFEKDIPFATGLVYQGVLLFILVKIIL